MPASGTGTRIAQSRSVDQTLLTAAAGMRSRLESLELLGNNIANAATAGFKRDHEFYNLFLGVEAEENRSGEFTWMPVVEGSAIDFSQAAVAPTSGPLDLALSGPGFFVVEGPQGRLYTRNGSFLRSPGGRLETVEGFPVEGEAGPLTLPPGEVKISQDGSVSVGEQPLGRLRVAEFAAAPRLAKVGRNYFRPLDTSAPEPASRTLVRQGHLEGSNVNAVEAAVRLVSVTRQFEMLGRAVTLVANEMNRRAIEELPRSGG